MKANSIPLTKRAEYIDVAKGFAIIAVVLVHIQFPNYGENFFPFKTILAGGMWCVPVFFILSGFFIKEEKLIKTGSFIKGKIKSIHFFSLYFYIPAILLHNIFIKIGFYSTVADADGRFVSVYNFYAFVKNILAALFFAGRELIVSPLWFTNVLCLAFIGYAILTAGCRKLIIMTDYKKIRFLICLFLASVSAVCSNKYDITIYRISTTASAMLLIATGQYIFQIRKIQFDSWYTFVVTCFFAWQNAVLNGNIHLDSNRFHDIFHLVCGSISSLYIICFISKKIVHTKVGFIFQHVGRNSFYIMALHIVSFKLLTLILTGFGFNKIALHSLTPNVDDNIWLIVGYTLCGIWIPMGFAKIISVIKKKISSTYSIF